ncbi:MAG: hypothetical protein DLM69_03915, partial [Candidatus Chloroheliales bacterium]
MELTAVQWGVVIAAFFASAVEYVEAFTIVLAVGVTRSWRSSLLGALAATATLVAIVGVLGVSLIQLVPIDTLRFIIGALLMLFGMKWLRKAILRYSRVTAYRNESAIYNSEVTTLEEEPRPAPGSFDKLGFAVSYKSVLLEGLEVAFIIISFGTGAKDNSTWLPAFIGAGAAAALVMIAGLLLRAPLARVPENALKFGVGLMLVSFGSFWAGEGAAVKWLGNPPDLSIVGLLLGYSL